MSLDLGQLLGSVDLIITPFERKYGRVVGMMSSLGAEAEKARAATAPLEESLAGVGEASNAASTGLTRAERAMRGAGVSASDAATATRALAISESQALDVTTELGLAQSKSTQAVLRATAAQIRLDAVQASGKATAGQLAAAQASVIAANDRVALSEDRVTKANMFGAATSNRLKNTWEGIPGPVKAGAAALVAVGAASLDAAKHYQDMTTRIHTQAHASVADTQALSAGMLHLSGIVGVLPTQLADAGYHVASVSQGIIGVSKQLDILKIAAEGAKLGGSDLVDTTNALDAAVVSGIKGVSNYSQAMGTLNATVGAGDMTMQDLADAFGTGLPASMAAFNVTLNQTGAALAVLGDNNIRGARAGTQLRMSVQALEHPVMTATAALAQLGLTGADAVNHFAEDLQRGGLTAALEDLHKRLVETGNDGKKSGQILTDIFGKRAGIGINVLINEYARYQSKLNDVSSASKQFSKDWDAYTKTFSFAVDRVKAGAVAMAVAFGDHLLPTATKAVGWLGTTGINDLERFGHALASNSMVTGGFHDLESAAGHVASAIRNIIVATEPLDRILLQVGGGAALVGFHALAAVLDGVATTADHLTGFFAHNEAAAIALSAVIGAALAPAVAATVIQFGRLIATQIDGFLVGIVLKIAEVVTAFTAADGAALGFAAALEALNLNPVMLAITAVVVAAAEFAHVLNDQSRAAFNAGKSIADSYIGSLNRSNTALAITKANTAALGNEMVTTARAGAGSVGGMERMAGKLSELSKAQQQSIAAAKTMSSNEATLTAQYGISQSTIERLARANGIDLAGSYSKVSAAVSQVVGPSAALHAAIVSLGKAAQGSASSVQSLDTQLAIMAGNSLGADQAAIAFRNDIVALEKALKKSNGSLSLHNQLGRDARAAFDAAATGALQHASALGKEKGGVDKARAALEREIGILKAHAGSSDYAKAAIARLNNALDALPASSAKGASGFGAGTSRMSAAARHAVAQIVAAFAGLKGDGEAAGRNLAMGLAIGIEERSGVAVSKAIALGAQAAHGVDTGAGNKSPSRKTRQSGIWLGMGLIRGMFAMEAPVKEAAAHLGHSAAAEVAAAIGSVYASISKALAPDFGTQLSTLLGAGSLGQAGALTSKTLGGDASKAVNLRAAAYTAHNDYLTSKATADAADGHAKALQHEANQADHAVTKAKAYADGLKGSTKAEKAAKAAAEEWATQLGRAAKINDDAAKSSAKAAAQADKAATKSKAAWDKAKQAADAAAQAAATDAQALVSSLSDAVTQMLSIVSDFKASVVTGLTGDYSFSTVWQSVLGTDENGNPINPTFDQFMKGLQSILQGALDFSADINTLITEGATPEVINQLLGMGPEAGDALAKSILAAGPDGVAAVVSVIGQIGDATAGEGDQLAGIFYGQGVNGMVSFIEGLESQYPYLKKALDVVIAMITDAGFDTSGTPSSSGTTSTGGPTNVRQHGPRKSPTPGVSATVSGWHGLNLPGFASGVTNFGGGLAYVHRDELLVNLPKGTDVVPRGGASAGVTATLHPDDRALLTAVLGRMDAGIGEMHDLAQRPTQVLIDRRVVGETSNEWRQERRMHGDPRYR